MSFFKKAYLFLFAHKKASTVVLIILIGYGAYQYYVGVTPSIRYVLSRATQGTVVVSMSGSGQVAAMNQADITSQVVGTIVRVAVKDGDVVKEGQVLAYIDTTDAVQTVNNASLALESAKLSYEKAIKQSNDQANDSTSSDLSKAYQDAYNAIANTSIDMPAIFAGLDDIFYNSTHSPYFADQFIISRVDSSAVSYKNQAGAIFDQAKRDYDANFIALKTISPSSSPADIVRLLNTTNLILTELLSALTGAHTTVDYINNRINPPIPSEIATDKSAISGFVTKVNSDMTSVTKALTAIDDAKDSKAQAELNLKSAELSVSQSALALAQAQGDFANHAVKAPFSGIVAEVHVKPSDEATTNTSVATLITKEKLVQISLNEIDAAKVAIGDKATLTFDALEDLALAGHVTNIDIVGTVSQGVVTYSVEIAFDDNDDRVKPGMTTNANIITDVKTDVLIVPGSAVKTQNGSSYIETMSGPYSDAEASAGVSSSIAPTKVIVETGLSNDSVTEIRSGITEESFVVVKTVSTGGQSALAPSILSGIGGTRNASGGSVFRAVTR